MTAHSFALFDTAIGRCGIAWGEGGVAGVQLPEAGEAETRARMLHRFPDAALVVYGQGLGAILIVEHKADTATPSGMISGMPTISLNGVTAHELATQLGTVLEWQQGGRSFVLAGSLPPAAAESAARELK